MKTTTFDPRELLSPVGGRFVSLSAQPWVREIPAFSSSEVRDDGPRLLIPPPEPAAGGGTGEYSAFLADVVLVLESERRYAFVGSIVPGSRHWEITPRSDVLALPFRTVKRVPIQVPVSLGASATRLAWQATTVDVSLTGVGLRAAAVLDAGQRIFIDFHRPLDVDVPLVRGRVVHDVPDAAGHHYGLAFVDLDPETLESLAEWLWLASRRLERRGRAAPGAVRS